MRAKKAERKLAEHLRKEQGLSYREIAAITGVAKSTLSYWLRDITLSPEHQARLQARLNTNRATFAARAWPINQARHQKARQEAYDQGVAVVDALQRTDAVRGLALAKFLHKGTLTSGR